jgi:elongation factor Ts
MTTQMIRELRELTGAGFIDCKKALENHQGNLEQAAAALREQGRFKAERKAHRVTGAGVIVVKTRENCAGAVEVACETDFVARTDKFKTFVHRLADQILADEGLTDTAKLLAANFTGTPGKTVAEALQELIAQLGENMTIRQAARYAATPSSRVIGYIHAGELAGTYGPYEGRIGILIELAWEPAATVNPAALDRLAHDLALHLAAASSDEIAADGWLQQPFIKDERLTVAALLQQQGQELGTTVTVKRCARLEVNV